MKRKDDSPILFEFYQTDMEKIMYQIDLMREGYVDYEQWEYIRDDLQWKINKHRERGEWV